MKSVRWDIIAASALLSVSLVISANLIAPPRYAAFALADYTFARLDQKTGDVIRCTWKDQCERVLTQPPDDLDNLMANVANEVENSN